MSSSGVEGLYKNFGILADSEGAGIEKVSYYLFSALQKVETQQSDLYVHTPTFRLHAL